MVPAKTRPTISGRKTTNQIVRGVVPAYQKNEVTFDFAFCVALSRKRLIQAQPVFAGDLKNLSNIGITVLLIPSCAVKSCLNREVKQITTKTATGTSPNKRFNEQNNSCARTL